MSHSSFRKPLSFRPASLLACAPTAFALGILCVTATGSMAQSAQGSLSGSVADHTGAVVRGASVVVRNDGTGVSNSASTNKAGVYIVQALNPGTYTVEVTAPSFKKSLTDHIVVGAAQSVEVDVKLEVGGSDVIVTVEADSALVTKDASDVATTVDHALVESLPYPERSSLGAILLVPGVTGDSLQPGGVSTENPGIFTGSVSPGASLAVGGSPAGTTSILVDGSDVVQGSFSRTGINLSGRDVQETTVVVSGLSAKYGRTGSGIVVQASRAGTNMYHGGVTWRHTDPYFNAFPLGGTIGADNHENFYGFYLGGPVRIPHVYDGHNRTFFFVGVEPARLRATVGGRASYLTPAELNGQYNDSLALLNQTVLKASGYAAALAAPRVGGIYYHSGVNAAGFPNTPLYNSSTLYKQVTGPLSDCSAAFRSANPSATLCPNDVGPQLAQNPFAQFFFSQLPTASNPGPHATFDNPQATYASDGTNGTYTRGVQNSDNRYNIRVDQQINNSNRFFARFTSVPVLAVRFLAVDPTNPISGSPGDAAYSTDFALGYTHEFNGSLINDLRYSFLRVKQERTPPAASLATDFAAKYGLTPAVTGFGFPSLGSFNSNGTSYTLPAGISNAAVQVDQNFIFGDDVVWSRGRHLFQFGVDLRWIQSNQYDQSGATGGKYAFSAGTTNNGTGGSALASFILGEINSFSNTPVPVPAYYRWHYDAAYFQDDWRIAPNLTLNLGVRYEVEQPRQEKNNNQAFVYNTAGILNGIATSTAFCFSGACGRGSTLWPTNYKGVEPRIGIAYAPTSRTSVRASYTLSRVPLSGYENFPDPNLNAASTGVSFTAGGTNPVNVTDYISNPVTPNLVSAYTALNGQRGPFYSSTGLAPVFVQQTTSVPYIQSYSLTTQFQAAKNTLLQAGYQGTRGTHIVGAFLPTNIPQVGQLQAAVQSHAMLGANTPNPYGVTQNGAVLTENGLQALEPYQNFFNQTLNEIYPRRGSVQYHSLYLAANQQFGNNLSFLATYVWQKSMDDIPDNNGGGGIGSGVSAPQNPFDQKSEYSVSSFDQPSRLKVGYTYGLPFGSDQRFRAGNGLIDRVIGGISTSGIITSQSGFPNIVTLGTNGYFTSITPSGVSGCAAAAGKVCTSNALPSGYTLRPNIVPGVPLINPNWRKNPFNSLAPGGITPYLNPAAFSVPGSPSNPQLGNAPRTLANARSPREFFFDARVVKAIKIKDKYTLNLNATFNNLLNHPVYYGIANRGVYSAVVADATGAPSVNSTNAANFSTLSQSNSAVQSRIIRFGAEFNF